MTILDRLAASNTKRLEETARMSDASTNTYIGQAVADSDGGSVQIILSDDAITPDWSGEGTAVTVPTTTAVHAGDNVLVQTFGGHVMTSPVVTGVVGRGDELQEIAEGAEAVANAVSQHFWSDTDGAHVTEVTQEEWNDAGGASYHSGANSLWNSLGMLFRDGLTNLLAILTDGIAIYDGNGNDAANIVAAFSSSCAQVGYTDGAHVSITDSGLTFADENGNVAGVMESGADIASNVTKTGYFSYPIVDGETVTIEFTGTPDFSSGPIYLALHDSYGSSYTFSFSSHGTVTVSNWATITTEASDNGWVATVSSLRGHDRIGIIAYTASWYTTHKEPLLTWNGHVEQSVKTDSIKLSNLGSGTKTLNLWREGHVVHASFVATATAGTANAAISCGTIPEGFRPIANEFQSGTCVTNNTLSGYYRWRVATTGAITYWCSTTAIRESPLCMTWLTEDAW